MVIDSNISIGYVVISLILIIILTYLLVNCHMQKKDSEKFGICTCTGESSKRCSDPFVTTALYDSSQLTENSPLAKIQAEQNKVLGGAPWKEIVPYDIFMDEQKGMKAVSMC